MNQCDGCRRKIPVENGIHHGPGGFWGGDWQVCTAHLYICEDRDCIAYGTRYWCDECRPRTSSTSTAAAGQGAGAGDEATDD